MAIRKPSARLNKDDLSPQCRRRMREDLSIPAPEILAYLQTVSGPGNPLVSD